MCFNSDMSLESNSSISAAEAAIRATGSRVTVARVRVLNVLRSAPKPLCHRDLETLLSNRRRSGIDRVTLYRVLDWLVENGLTHRAADARGVSRFTAAQPHVEHSRHMHFRCTGCGNVICLDAPPPKPPKLPKGFYLSGMELDVRGECQSCHHHSRAAISAAGLNA